jgi:hypothetical protein
MEWREATDEETGCLLLVGDNQVGLSVELLPVDAGVPQAYPAGITVFDAKHSKFCYGKEYVFYIDEQMFAGKIDHNAVMIKRGPAQ